jgi:hypothetical protein
MTSSDELVERMGLTSTMLFKSLPRQTPQLFRIFPKARRPGLSVIKCFNNPGSKCILFLG